MSGPSPLELDRILSDGLALARWNWRRPFRRRRIALPARVTNIQGTAWIATRDNECWSCTVRQARRMRQALVPVLGMYGHQVEVLVEMLKYQAP